MQLYRLNSISHQLATTIVQCSSAQLGCLCTYLGYVALRSIVEPGVSPSSFLVLSRMYFLSLNIMVLDCVTFFVDSIEKCPYFIPGLHYIFSSFML